MFSRANSQLQKKQQLLPEMVTLFIFAEYENHQRKDID